MSGGASPTASVMDAKRQAAVESLFENLPESFGERRDVLQAIRQAFYKELANNFVGPLNAYAQLQPHTTREEYSALASWVNETVKQLGLSVLCPKTHRPAALVSDTSTKGSREILRFRFQTYDASGRHVRSAASTELPDLELTQAPRRIENLSKSFKDRKPSSPSR